MQAESETQNDGRLKRLIEKSRVLYATEPEIWCPYFKSKITLNADGFNHLLYKPNRQPRNVSEQILKLSLLRKAIGVIRQTGTLQEFRNRIEKLGKPAKDGFMKTKHVQYWGFHAILGEEKLIKIVVVVKQNGDGKLIFWSVLPHKRFNNPKLYSEGIEED